MTMVNQGDFAADEWPNGADVIEPAVNQSVFFTGIRATAVNGVAHLILYVEQPSAHGGTEFVVIARLVTPLSRAKAILETACASLSQPAPRNKSHPEVVLQ